MPDLHHIVILTSEVNLAAEAQLKLLLMNVRALFFFAFILRRVEPIYLENQAFHVPSFRPISDAKLKVHGRL